MPVYQYLYLKQGEDLPACPVNRPFKAILILDSVCEPERQKTVSEWLVDQGCLYAMSVGENCASWDDSIDWANIDQFQGKEIPDESYVFTTWHENEPLEEVFWFAANAAVHPTTATNNYLIIQIDGPDLSVKIHGLAEQNGLRMG